VAATAPRLVAGEPVRRRRRGYYSLIEPECRPIEPCKKRALNAGTDAHFGNDGKLQVKGKVGCESHKFGRSKMAA